MDSTPMSQIMFKDGQDSWMENVVVNGNGVYGHISANMDTDNSTGVALD